MISECWSCQAEILKRRTEELKEPPKPVKKDSSIAMVSTKADTSTLLKIKKLTSEAKLPVQQTEGSIGLDLSAS